MELLEQTLERITAADRKIKAEIKAHLDDLTKPPGSLGRLEELALRYCLATGSPKPALGMKTILCFAGDHGVATEGVSAYPKEVTPQMVANMLAGGAAINVLSRHAGASLKVIDMGVDFEFGDMPGLCRKKIRRGSGNIARGPAMTKAEARRAVETGIELALAAADEGATMIGTGEMGIANTTPASAIIAALLPCPPENVVGRGTGIDDAKLAAKTGIVRRALEVNRAALGSPLEALAALGGFEIAGICGALLGAASRKIPVVVDGFISSAAALVALRMREQASDYMFFSHLSRENGHDFFMKKMGVRPILDLEMRLGEGTGAALAMTVIEAAVKIYNEMATFSSAGVSGKETPHHA